MAFSPYNMRPPVRRPGEQEEFINAMSRQPVMGQIGVGGPGVEGPDPGERKSKLARWLAQRAGRSSGGLNLGLGNRFMGRFGGLPPMFLPPQVRQQMRYPGEVGPEPPEYPQQWRGPAPEGPGEPEPPYPGAPYIGNDLIRMPPDWDPNPPLPPGTVNPGLGYRPY